MMTKSRVATAVCAVVASVVFLAGCAAAPMAPRVEPTHVASGPTSLLDLRWAFVGAPSLSGAGGGSEAVFSERLASPEEYRAAQKGRATTEALPKLAPLPETGIWSHKAPQETKPELAIDMSLIKVRQRPPIPGVEEILRGSKETEEKIEHSEKSDEPQKKAAE